MALSQLAQYLSGSFENRQQSLEQPAWFVHLRLWHRPLPFLLAGNRALFAEQAPIVKLDQPYRQRVMVLGETVDVGDGAHSWRVEYRQFKDPSRFRGAGINPAKLQSLSPSDLIPLPGCELRVTQQQQRFVAQPLPEAICCFEYEGKKRQVVLGFEVTDREFKSYDRGIDPETGQSLWGALMGPYVFDKIESFSIVL